MDKVFKEITHLKCPDAYFLNLYKNRIKILIEKTVNRKCKKFVYEPTILGDNSQENIEKLTIAHSIRQKQMKEGEIAQIILGNFIGWQNLKVGHKSGLDCRKLDNSIAMELKNKYNTCNSDSLKMVLEKLSKYKKFNPETRCVIGIVNPKKNTKILHEKFFYKDVEIEKLQGKELFKLVFSYNGVDYSQEIIDFTTSIIYKNKI